PHSLEMRYQTTAGDRTFAIAVERREERLVVTVDGREHWADLRWIAGQERYSLILDGASYEIFVEDRGETKRVYIEGQPFDVKAQDERLAALQAVARRPVERDLSTRVTAPMPGAVIELNVEVGQAVEAGRPLLLIEAMKMHNEVRAPRAGVVEAIAVGVGQRVERDQHLVTIR